MESLNRNVTSLDAMRQGRVQWRSDGLCMLCNAVECTMARRHLGAGRRRQNFVAQIYQT